MYPIAVPTTAIPANNPQDASGNAFAAEMVVPPSIIRFATVPHANEMPSIFITLARAMIGLPTTEYAASQKNEETKITLASRPPQRKSGRHTWFNSITPTSPNAKPVILRGPICSFRKMPAATDVTSGSSAIRTAELPAVPN